MRIMATSDLHGNLEGLDPKGAFRFVLGREVTFPTRIRRPRSLVVGAFSSGRWAGWRRRAPFLTSTLAKVWISSR